MPVTQKKIMSTSQASRNSRVKVSRRLNESAHEHIRHTFLSAGGHVSGNADENLPKDTENKGLTPLHNECFYNHSSKLVQAIHAHLDDQPGPDTINSQDKIGLSPLHLLCGFNGSCRFIQALELLLERGANVRVVDLRGYTPFHYLSYNTLLETEVQLQGLAVLLRHGSDINAKEFKVKATALHILCNYNTNKKLDDILSFFVLHRASLHARTIENRTALHCICRTNGSPHLLSAVTLLMRHGSDANVRDYKNMTALHDVCLFYRRDNLGQIIDQLLNTKANCINFAAMHKRSALHLVALHYHHENLPQLLQLMVKKHGADVNQSDEKYRTPFHYLLQHNRSPSWFEAVEVLIRNGADVEARDLKYGRDALLHACLNYYQTAQLPKMLAFLLKNGSDVNILDKSKRSLLHYLTSTVNLDICSCLETLLPHLTVRTIDAASIEGTTALTQAARLGCIAALKQLIPLATKNVTDAFGKNVLDYLKELRERKMRSLCLCCSANSSGMELTPTLVKQLTVKDRIIASLPTIIGPDSLDPYLLDTCPYTSFKDESRLVKPPSEKWIEFINLWQTTKMFQPKDVQQLKNFLRDFTHPCKLPPLLPVRRNKCGWCDTIGTVYNYIKTITERAGQMDRRFRPAAVVTYGSIPEGTRLLAPDAFHFAVVMESFVENPSCPSSVHYVGTDRVDMFHTKKNPPNVDGSKLSKYYHCLISLAMTWVQHFEMFHHWKICFDEAITTIYLVHRPKNNAPPFRLAVSLLLAVRRAPDATLIRSDLPSWGRLAERGEEMEYLTPKGSESWKASYPAIERDSIRHSGTTVLQVLQLCKLLVTASNSNKETGLLEGKQDPSTFMLKSSLLIYMELNPPPWNSVDIITHTLGVIDIILDKHDFSLNFFDAKEKLSFKQMPLFSPISFETKRVIMLIKLRLAVLLNDKHHSFTI